VIVVKLNVLNLIMNWKLFLFNCFQGKGLKFDIQQTARHDVTVL